MFKVTCILDPRRTVGTPGKFGLESPRTTVARTEGTGAQWRAHRSTASDRSGALKLTGGGAIERGEHGELSSGGGVVTWRCGGVKKSQEAWWRGVLVRERRREGLGEVWGAPGVVRVAFIGPGEGDGGWLE
jgi:hypothetical protein